MTSIVPTPSAPVEQEPFDASLRRRAKKVIPGGLWGHMNAARLPEGYPQYLARARGCRLRDVDDNEYVDFMCSYGPRILGYGDENVERAAARQRAEADIANGPAPCAVELAEFVVATVPHADWVIFAKNGTDATTTCVTLARAGTGRRKVHFDYNDVASLEAAVDEAGAILTVEEHNVIGGLGSAVAEVLVDCTRVPFRRHGIEDEFAPVGPPAGLYAHYKLDAVGIASVAGEMLALREAGWPGVGSYAVAAARALDHPAIIGVTIVGGAAFLLVPQDRRGLGSASRRTAQPSVPGRAAG